MSDFRMPWLKRKIVHGLDRLADVAMNRQIPPELAPRLRLGVAAATAFVDISQKGRLRQIVRYYVFVNAFSGVIIEALLDSEWFKRWLVNEIQADPARAMRRTSIAKNLHSRLRFMIAAGWRLNLSGLQLRDCDLDTGEPSALQSANLSGSRLLAVRFFGRLTGSIFNQSRLSSSAFLAADISSARFEAVEIIDTVFFGVRAIEVNFSESVLSRVTFWSCLLCKSSFSNAILDDVLFEDVDLESADFTGAVIKKAVFRRCTNVAAIKPQSMTWEAVDDAEYVIADSAASGPPFAGASAAGRYRRIDRIADRHSHSLTLRYGEATPYQMPPLGYRVEVLVRKLIMTVSMFGYYQRMRRHATRDAVNSDGAVGLGGSVPHLPRHPILAALSEFFGLGAPGNEQIAKVVRNSYHECTRAVSRAFGYDSEDVELVVIESPTADARHVAISGRSYIVATSGLFVFCARLAKYCVAWILPPAISFAEGWKDASTYPDRDFLRPSFSHVISGSLAREIPTIQLSGLRLMQAEYLAKTWFNFVFAHELGHHFLALSKPLLAEILDLVGKPREGLGSPEEIACDVFAARVILTQRDDLNGDNVMLELLKELTTEDVKGYLADMGYSKSEVEEGIVEGPIDWAKAGTLGTEANWFPTAVACLLILRLSSTGGLGSVDAAWARALLVAELAYGPDAAASLRVEGLQPDSVLNMLRNHHLSTPDPR